MGIVRIAQRTKSVTMQNNNSKGYIDYSEPKNPMFWISINNHDYGFSLASFKGNPNWLIPILSKICNSIHHNACDSTRKEIREGMQNLLGWENTN